ncbi:MAG: hypothetical protein L3K09_02495, partial [Thermoplasmata archaeon]|nr:hypothetical protein [Thermoplasmata archaeon]
HPRAHVEYGWLISHGSPGGGKIVNLSMNATDQPAFVPYGLSATAGAQVSLSIDNTGSFAHTFTLARQANFTIPVGWSPSQLTAYFQANGSLVDMALPPGKTTIVNFTVPSDAVGGSFEFVSTVAYQFQAGMHGQFNVTSTAGGPTTELMVNATNGLLFDPGALSVAGPGPVAILVTNLGSIPHTFTVAPQSNVTITPGNFTSYFAAHAPLANVNVPGSAGASVWANFTVPAKGIFEFICEIPGHFAAGMSGELYVGVAPPMAAAAPSTAIVMPAVLLGAGGLLGVGALLAVIASFTGRIPESAPSEHGHHP